MHLHLRLVQPYLMYQKYGDTSKERIDQLLSTPKIEVENNLTKEEIDEVQVKHELERNKLRYLQSIFEITATKNLGISGSARATEPQAFAQRQSHVGFKNKAG